MAYLRANEFGRSNPKSKRQNRVCMFFMFREFEELRQDITLLFRTRDCELQVIEMIRRIPHLDPASYIYKIHAQLYHTDLGNSANTLLAGLDGLVDLTPELTLLSRQQRREASKAKAAKKALATAANPVLKAIAAGSKNPPPLATPACPAIPPPLGAQLKYCLLFNSTVGCPVLKCRFAQDRKSTRLNSSHSVFAE